MAQSMKKNHGDGCASARTPIDLEAVFGAAWAGVVVSPGGLLLPGWRNPVPPCELRACFWRAQQVGLLEAQAARLTAEMEQARASADRAEAQARWYRSQLVAESRAALLARWMR